MYYEPFVGKATIAVLEHNGFEVIVPPQNCCGLPMLSNGEFGAARGYHKSNVSTLAGFARAGIPIVGTSTSCTLTLKEEAPELLDMEDDATVLLKMGTWDIFEFLRQELQSGELRTDFKTIQMMLPYHAPCQQRAHRIGKPALEIMELIPGLDLRESNARCCGIAGTYGYKAKSIRSPWMWAKKLFSFVKAQGDHLEYTASRFGNLPLATRTWHRRTPSRRPIGS